MSFDKFLKARSSNSDQDYSFLGFDSEITARMRYLEVLNHLTTKFKDVKVVADMGCGLATMWLMDEYKPLIDSLSMIYLVENNPVVLEKLRPRMADLGEKFVLVEESMFNRSAFEGGDVDVFVSIGAVNYYSVEELIQFLNLTYETSKQGYIVETNIQSGETGVSPGNFNYSLDFLYQLIYCQHLKQGGNARLDMSIIKKWTAILTVNKTV